MESKEIEENKGRMALEISKTVSFIPNIIAAFQTSDPSKTIQPLAEKIRKETGAEFVVIGNKEGTRYSHPQTSLIGKKMKGGDNERALKNGEYYVSKAKGSLGPSIRGKSPIMNKEGEVIGIVSVGFLLEDVHQQIMNNVTKVLLVSAVRPFDFSFRQYSARAEYPQRHEWVSNLMKLQHYIKKKMQCFME